MKFSLLKKIIAVSLVFATLMFAGCQKDEPVNDDNPSEEISQNDVVQENNSVEETSEVEETKPTEEETTKKEDKNDISITVVDGIISNTDRNNFSEMLGHMIYHNADIDAIHPEDGYTNIEFFMINYKDYNYKSESAKRYAYRQLFGSYYTLLEEMADIYNWNSKWDFEYEYVSNDSDEGEPDPKGAFGDNYGYYKISGKYVDICLETVFNIAPDHEYVFKSNDGELMAYYHNGYYYAYYFDGYGDVSGPDVKINDIAIMNDGKYQIKATYYEGVDDELEKLCDLNVVAEMKEVDGKSIWSFYTITKV